jgi:general secretion pathway protein G
MKTLKKTAVSNSREWKCRYLHVAVPGKNRAVLDNHGFTLLELMMVCLILVVLVTIAIPSFINYRDSARVSRAMSEIRMLEAAIAAFYSERGTLPTQLSDIGYGTLLDPWGKNYQYSQPPSRLYAGTPVNSDYDLWSMGADTVTTSASLVDNEDDIIRANDGGSVGLAKQLFTP